MAAVALNVTQTAVSKQIKTLEERLGVALFERRHRHVMLTEAGQRYRRVAEQVLETLEAGKASASLSTASTTVHVDVDYDFLNLVLSPRVAALHAAFSGVSFHFNSMVNLSRSPRPDTDLSITYGRPSMRDQNLRKLCSFEVIVVGAPQLVSGVLEPIKTLPLLHDLNTSWWDEILADMKITRSEPAIILGQAVATTNAALAGQGLIVGDSLICADALAQGRLVQVSDFRAPGREDYWIARKSHRKSAPLLDEIGDWLIEQTELMLSVDW